VYYNIKIIAKGSELGLESQDKSIIEREMDIYFARIFGASEEFLSKIKPVEINRPEVKSIDEIDSIAVFQNNQNIIQKTQNKIIKIENEPIKQKNENPVYPREEIKIENKRPTADIQTIQNIPAIEQEVFISKENDSPALFSNASELKSNNDVLQQPKIPDEPLCDVCSADENIISFDDKAELIENPEVKQTITPSYNETYEQLNNIFCNEDKEDDNAKSDNIFSDELKLDELKILLDGEKEKEELPYDERNISQDVDTKAISEDEALESVQSVENSENAAQENLTVETPANDTVAEDTDDSSDSQLLKLLREIKDEQDDIDSEAGTDENSSQFHYDSLIHTNSTIENILFKEEENKENQYQDIIDAYTEQANNAGGFGFKDSVSLTEEVIGHSLSAQDDEQKPDENAQIDLLSNIDDKNEITEKQNSTEENMQEQEENQTENQEENLQTELQPQEQEENQIINQEKGQEENQEIINKENIQTELQPQEQEENQIINQKDCQEENIQIGGSPQNTDVIESLENLDIQEHTETNISDNQNNIELQEQDQTKEVFDSDFDNEDIKEPQEQNQEQRASLDNNVPLISFNKFLSGFMTDEIHDEFLICAAYIKTVLNESTFTMKYINSKLFQATGKIADTSIVDDLIKKEYIKTVEADDSIKYAIAAKGEEYLADKLPN